MPTTKKESSTESGAVPWTLFKSEAVCEALPGLCLYEFQRGTDDAIVCFAQTDLEPLYTRHPGLKKMIAQAVKSYPEHKTYFKTKPFENREHFQQCFSNNATNGKCLVPLAVVQESLAALSLETEARRESISTFVAKMNQQEKQWVLAELVSSVHELVLPPAALRALRGETGTGNQPASSALLADVGTHSQSASPSAATTAAPTAGFFETFAARQTAAAAAAAAAVAAAASDDVSLGSECSMSDDALSAQSFDYTLFASGNETVELDDVVDDESDVLDHHKRKRGTAAAMYDLPGSPLASTTALFNSMSFPGSSSANASAYPRYNDFARIGDSNAAATLDAVWPEAARPPALLTSHKKARLRVDDSGDYVAREGSLLFGARPISNGSGSGSSANTNARRASMASRFWNSAVDRLLPNEMAPAQMHLPSLDPFGDVPIEQPLASHTERQSNAAPALEFRRTTQGRVRLDGMVRGLRGALSSAGGRRMF